MRWQPVVRIAACFAAHMAPLVCPAHAADRIYYNARIFTADPEHPYAEAVAIRGGRFLAAGNRMEVMKAAGPGAEQIDLDGGTLLPGLIDSHMHAIEGGLSLISADASDKVQNMGDLIAFVADAKESGRGMRGDILCISGLPLGFWSKIDDLNAHFSTGVYEKQSVVLGGMDGHTRWANRAMLRKAGIDKEYLSGLPAAARRYYGIAPNGEPNGFTADAGMRKLSALLPRPTPEQLLEGARAALRHNHRLGITSWIDPNADASVLATYRALAERGELDARVVAFPSVSVQDPAGEVAAIAKLREKFKDVPNVTVAGLKVFADGVAEYPSQTAAMSAPYRNSGARGDLLFDTARFAELAIAADKNGLIVHVHAIGDRAITEALNGIEAARKANGDSGLPHTLTHLQFVGPGDISRFKKLGVIASLQLFWASAEVDTIDILQPYIDPSIYRWQYPARSLLSSGAVIAGASDWPVSTANVFMAIYQAETRKGPKGVLLPAERMPREAMLLAYTRNAARAMNQQDSIGSIAAGKRADMVLVDRDVLMATAEEVKDTKVVWTMVAGKIVHVLDKPL
jgi:predicted amidohydrolase YtcJ